MRGNEPRAWILSAQIDPWRAIGRLPAPQMQVGWSRDWPPWEPPVDMHQRQGELGVLVALPGVTADRCEVSLEQAVLVVRAERAHSVSFASGHVVHLEIPYGRFERRIQLPDDDYRLVSMQLEHGCLRLQLARST